MAPTHRKPGLTVPASGAERVVPAEAMRRAFEAFQRGKLAEAERICKVILGDQPDYFDALHLFGVVAARRGNLAEADRLLSRALSVNPKSAEAHSTHGNVLLARGHFEKALASYDLALAINPNL